MPRSMNEYGRVGQRRYSGIFSEEFLPELRGTRGIEVYREMAENDDMCSAILYAIETLIRQADWGVQAGGSTTKDRECAEFIESCLDDMQDTWTDTVSEILSFLTYGWSYHEIVYKRRTGDSRDFRLNSKYADGLIGWQKLPIRSQETLHQWEYDSNDNLVGMTQITPPEYRRATIPIEKALLFRTKSRKNNPEGRSILRGAYRDWYFKRRIQEIEGMGVERDLAGLPLIITPESMDIWNDADPVMVNHFNRAETIVRNVRRDSTEGLVLPFGWELKLLTSGGARQFDTSKIIERYDSRIAMTAMADFLLLGHRGVGSFALSKDKSELFSLALCAYLDIICDTINGYAVPRLLGMNAEHFQGITDYPYLTHGKVETPKLSELSAYLRELTGCGIIMPDESLEDYVRKVGNLPERLNAQQFDPQAREDPSLDIEFDEEAADEAQDDVRAAKRRFTGRDYY